MIENFGQAKSEPLAPIVLFVYNRPIHTERTLSALKRNSLAEESDLIIFSDGPKNVEDLKGVEAVRELVSGLQGFRSVKTSFQEENLGLANSVISGVTKVVSQYGKVIVLEDDLEVSERFLEFMNSALNHYEGQESVFSIGGYQFPEITMPIPSAYEFDTYTGFRCCSWGWATWADRWKQVDWNIEHTDDFFDDPVARERFNRGGEDLTVSLLEQRKGQIDSWAIRYCFSHFINGKFCIYPTKTLVRNIGLDGSGVHCGVDPSREHIALDQTWCPMNFCDGIVPDREISERFAHVFNANRLAQKFGIRFVPKRLRNKLAVPYFWILNVRKK
jgi:hypothetical protein